jgi:pyrroloquinoline-quinone synthase
MQRLPLNIKPWGVIRGESGILPPDHKQKLCFCAVFKPGSKFPRFSAGTAELSELYEEFIMQTQLIGYAECMQEIEDYIHENRYSKHVFIQKLVDGVFSQEGLKNWAIQKYHQTYMQNCMFSAIHSSAIEYEDIRRFAMMQLIAEETKIADGSDSHYNLMKRFVIALGATEKEIKNTTVGKPVLNYINYIIPLCRNLHPVYGMLAVFAIESQSSESVKKMYIRLKNQFNFDDHILEWFVVHHSQVEDTHASGARKLILKHAPNLKDFFEQSKTVVQDTIRIWKDLQDYYASLMA